MTTDAELAKRATQRGARMQIMRRWMKQYTFNAGGFVDHWCWNDFLKEYPDADDWFDDNGVPKG